MAAITSAQAGNWSSTSTWTGGVVPTDGDTLTINHNITYDITTAQTTGIGDSTINTAGGITFNADTRLTINGVWNWYGNCIMTTANVIVYGNGSSSENHRIEMRPTANTNSFLYRGEDPLPATTVSANAEAGDTFIRVSSSTGFVAGEWVSAFRRGMTNHTTDRVDEGFFIHEVNGTQIYLRDFVGPEASVTSVNGSNVHVSNSDIFRIGQAVITGTGSNRVTGTITAIDSGGVLTLNTDVGDADPSGSTIYTSGVRKPKVVNDIFRKVATTVSTKSAASSNTLYVRDSTDYDIGDLIVVDARHDDTDQTIGDDKQKLHSIVAKSGNTLTLDPALGFQAIVDSFVVKMNRSITFKLLDETNDHFYFRINENSNANYNTTFEMKDVAFNLRSTNSYYNSRFVPGISGEMKSATDPDSFEVEGITSYRDPDTTGTPTRQEAIHLRRWGFRSTWRNCSVFNSFYGFWIERGYDWDDTAWFNIYSARSKDVCFRWQDQDGKFWEGAYLFGHRSEDRLLASYGSNRFAGQGFNQIWLNNSDNRGFESTSPYGQSRVYQSRIQDTHQGLVYVFNQNTFQFIYCEFNKQNSDRNLDYSLDGIQDPRYGGHGGMSGVPIMECNYDINKTRMYFPGGIADWDIEEQAWFCNRDKDVGSWRIGILGSCFVPAHTTLKVKGEIKLPTGFSGSVLHVQIRSSHNRYDGEQDIAARQFSTTNDLAGSIVSVDFPSNTLIEEWQDVVATYGPFNFGTFVNYGVIADNNNQSEGWYQKPYQISFTPNRNPAQVTTGHGYSGATLHSTGDLQTTQRLRLGGRIR